MAARSRRQRRLVLYSGGQERRNAQIHESLLGLAMRNAKPRNARTIRLGYVPYTHEGALPFFRRFERRYRAFGGTHFECVSADLPGPDGAARLAACDIVYLAGGNTFVFLDHLRCSGLLPVLERFAKRGGVLAGLSAGAHLMSPDIGLAGFPEFDHDDNRPGLRGTGLRALGLVDFDFFPHYRNSTRYREALAHWSTSRGRPVYASRDGGGLVVEHDRFTVHGDVWLFAEGHVVRLG